MPTLGTNATNSLDVAFVWQSMATATSSVRAINQAILDDQNPRHPVAQTSGCGGFVKEGILYVPNRGSLTLFPGDCVALDSTSGQVILVPSYLRSSAWTLAGGALGTNAVGTLDTAVVWTPTISEADVALVNLALYDDQEPPTNLLQAVLTGSGGLSREGVLGVPSRGSLTLFPGDVVAVNGTTGCVILLTAYGLSAGPWTLT